MFRRQNSTKYYQDGLTKEWFGDHKEAFKLFLKAAELDNTEAQVKVADYYRVGIYTEQNLPEALYLYEKAAEKGDSLGQFYCAEMYYYGQGCEPDTDTAMYWLDRARKENNWDTGMEAVSWIAKCVENGAGEVVLNSIDTDGVKGGFDLEMLNAVCEAVNVPVIASGGAGCVQDFVTLFRTLPKVDAGLAASIFHFGEVQIPDLKRELRENDITVRL